MSSQASKYLPVILVMVGLFAVSCDSSPLDEGPKGALSEDQVTADTSSIEGLVIAAYAGLGNGHWFVPHAYNWVYGAVASDNTYKGGLGTSDQGDFHGVETRSLLRTDNERSNQMWERLFFNIDRANSALRALRNAEDFSLKERRIAEMRFIRGHFYFQAKKMYNQVPYIDETVTGEEKAEVSNVELSSNELWNKIAADFQAGVDNLPETQSDVGRADQIDAKAYLAKTRLFQAYEKNDNHQVTSINQSHLQSVIDLTQDIIASGKHGLFDSFAGNHLWSFDNGQESLFAVQRSRDDGTTAGRLNRETSLNYPMIQVYGCCSFNTPSQDLANAFQTGTDGLPKYDTYNENEVRDPTDFQQNTFDPRLDHTIGHPGAPLKYQDDLMYDTPNFVRAASVYGPFTGAKSVALADCPCLERSASTGFREDSDNTEILKYNEVLLWKAEAHIERGEQDQALPLINQVRRRAANSTDRVSYSNGDTYSNYNIEEYEPGNNITWNQENARRALRWERRLEFAMEGKRFFDLVRWGIAAEVMNDYYDSESERREFLAPAEFTQGKHEYLPIPEQQIDFSDGVYEQNPGY